MNDNQIDYAHVCVRGRYRDHAHAHDHDENVIDDLFNNNLINKI